MTTCVLQKENRTYLLVSRPAPIRGHGGEEKKGVVVGGCTALALSIDHYPRTSARRGRGT